MFSDSSVYKHTTTILLRLIVACLWNKRPRLDFLYCFDVLSEIVENVRNTISCKKPEHLSFFKLTKLNGINCALFVIVEYSLL